MASRMAGIAAAGLVSLALTPGASAQVPEPPVTEEELPYSAAAEPTPTPTPTATPTPTPEVEEPDQGEVGAPPRDATKRVRRVYRDFRRDALISPCDHTLHILRVTRDTVPEDFDEAYPDFVESLNAAIMENRELDCEALAEDEDEAAEQEKRENDGGDEAGGGGSSDATGGGGTGSSGGSGSGGGSTSATPIDPFDPLPADPLPADPGGGEEEMAPDPLPPVETVAPLPEAMTPPAAPVAPPPAAPVAPTAPAVQAEPAVAPAPVWGLAAGGGLLALGGLLAPLVGARGGARMASFQHAWGEAGFRIRGVWQDFGDWLRVGR